MAERDLNAELFGTSATPKKETTVERDLNAELFGEANPFKETAAPAPTNKQPVPSKSTPVDGSYGMMGEYIEPDLVRQKYLPSVMNVAPSGTPPVDQGPVRPEVRRSIRGKFDSADPVTRGNMLANEGWIGDIAREREAELKRFGKVRKAAPESRFLEKVSPSVLDRTQRLIEAGEKPDFARVAAEEAAAAGVEPGDEINFMRAKGLAEPRPVDEAVASEYEKASTLERGLAKTKTGTLEFIYGVNQFAAELVGADEFARAQGLSAAEQDKLQNSIGENPDYWKRQTENIIASSAQNAPLIALGLLSGGATLPMAGMFLQQFGQSYAESRRLGLSPTEATARASWMGMAEVLGEIPGFSKQLQIARGFLKTAPLESLKQWITTTAKKEVSGEQFTLAMQTFGDVKGVTPFGTREAPSVEQYLQMMADTLVQTVGQSALMGGSVAATSKVAQTIQNRFAPAKEPEEPIPTAEQIMRDKGFLVKPSRTASGKATTETVMEAAAGEKAGETTKRVEPTLAPLNAEQKAAQRQTKVEETATKLIETSGIDPETAMKIAEGRVRAQEQQEQKRQDEMQTEVAKRPTLIEAAETRIQEITNDLIDAGMSPIEAAARAVIMAQQEAENDALAEQGGDTNVGKPITKAGGVGAGVSGERSTGVPAGGTDATLATGLVPAGTTTGEFTEGKAVQPGTLNLEERAGVRAALAESLDQQGVSEDEKTKTLQRFDERTQRQQEEASGSQTLETIEAETQGTAAEETGVSTTTGKRGRPRLAPEAKLTSEEKRKGQRAAYKTVEKQVNDAERALAQAAEPINEEEATSDDHLLDMQGEKARQRQFAINDLYDVSKTNRGKPGARAKALLAQATPRELQTAEAGHQLRKQREAASKAAEAAASTTVADAKLGKVTNGAQAITQIIKTGTKFQKALAKRLRSFVSNVKVIVIEVGDPLPEGITKTPEHKRSWDRARAMFIENYATGARTIYVRGASFGEDQGVNNITMLHELWHAATNKKVELGLQAIERGLHKNTQLVRATEDLIQIMNNASDRFDELAGQDKLPEKISRLAEFGDIFDDAKEFIAYGMTEDAFQDFLKSTGSIGGTTSYWSMFVDALRRLVGMDEADTNALGDLLNAVDSILTARPVGQLDLTELMSPMAMFGFGKPKDTTTKFAGETITTKPSANAKRLAALLGAKLYGDPTDIAKVSIKEIFQNSFDAIKGALEKGQLKDGKIAIKLDEKARTITITDNGLGMPASVMGNEFLTIAGTVKETDRASGGLGIAKMLFLFGNEKMEVVSLRDGQLARMVTTGDEVMAALDDPSLAPKITTSTDPNVIKQYVESTFPDGHGTTIVVQIPKSFKDASTGEEKNIPFDIWQLESSKVLTDSPLFDNIKVTLDAYGSANTLPIGKNFPIDDYTAFANVNFDWGTARVYVQKETQDYLPRDNTHILSNGLWQFDTNIKDRPGWDGNKIKRNFYIDVNPKVKPEDAGYPFDLNRQGFAPSIRGDFDKIFKYITVIYQQQSLAEEGKSFGQIQYVNDDGTLTKPEELVPEVPATPTAFTMIKPDDKVEVRDGVMYVNGRAVPELTDADLKNTVVRIEELTIPQDKIDTNRVMVHDNTLSKTSTPTSELTLDDLRAQLPEGWTIKEDPNSTVKRFVAIGPQVEGAVRMVVNGRNIEYLANRLGDRGIHIQRPFETKQATLSEVAREMFGKKYDEYLVGIGNIFMELRNALATEYNGKYTSILNEAIGISLDKEYYGVSIRVPFSGLYINPATTSLTGNSKQIAVSMIGTMIHEMAHHKERGHGADWGAEMQLIMNLLETHPTFDLADAKKKLTDHIQKNINIFDFLNGEFKNGNLEPRGNRFQDASTIESGNAGVTGAMEGASDTGEESRPGVSGGFGPSYQSTGQVGVGAGNAGETAEAGTDAVRTQKEIDKEEDIAIEKIKLSRDNEEIARQAGILQGLRDPRKMLPALRSLWDTATDKRRKFFLNLVTRDTLAVWGGSYIPELKNTHNLINEMGNLTKQLLAASADLAKTINNAYKQDKTETLPEKLADVAYLSTLIEINPADTNAKERGQKLDKAYAKLGAKGQQIYKLLVEQARNIADYYSALLDEQVDKAQLTPDIKNRLMAQIRQMYETKQKINPYFQLVRRGDYVLRVGQGEHRQFYTAPTLAARDAIANELARERRTSVEELEADGDIEKINDIGVIRKSALDSSPMLKSLFDLIDSEQFGDPDAKENLKESVYQLYLTTMPDQSFRNQFLNRKQITGFSTDLLRNFSESSTRMAVQLAKIKYAPLLRNSLSAAQHSISGRSGLQPFVSEMKKRVELKLNPGARTAGDIFSDGVNRATSIYYLSGWSTAFLQPLSIIQTAYPILSARYGYVNTLREFTKMLKVWDQYGVSRKLPDGSMSYTPPTIINAKGITADEKLAIRDMASIVESTYIGEMFGYKQTPTVELQGAYNKTKSAAATAAFGLLYSTERLSREFTALAAYRLKRQELNKAVKAGKLTAEQARKKAVQAAIHDTTEALGDYSVENRPPVMQRGLGKSLLQFTMFQLHMTLFLLRNFKRMTLSMASPAERWEATKIFFGVMGTSFMLGGIPGLPMFSIILGLIGWFWKDEDKPQEFKDMDYETWWRTIHLPDMLGKVTIGGVPLSNYISSEVADRGVANALTGWDIASRTSLNNMWLRDIKETKTVREEAIAIALEKAGPSAAMILAGADAAEAAMNGDYQKAAEKMSPALIRNLILSYKYANEGARDTEGTPILLKGDYTTGLIIGQMIGFRADVLADQQQLAFKLKANVQRVENERSKLLNNLYREYRIGSETGEWGKYLKQLEAMNKFNIKYPSKAITSENLLDSFEKRMEQRALHGAWAGMPITEENIPLIGEPAVKAVEKKEKRDKEKERKEGRDLNSELFGE
jgi:hypothetical protein